MGEIADWLLEQMDDVLDINGLYDDCWPPEYYPHKKIPICRYCGKTPLRWRKINEKWVLHEMDGNYHDCPEHPLPLNVLKDIMAQKKMNTQQLLPIPSWDEQFMHDAYWWARRSKDPRSKIGAVLVKPGSKVPFSHAYNGFARKVDDDVELRWERPEKYEWVVHAEENAVLNCAGEGHCSVGSVLYTQGVPCTRCADACIQGGIIEIVVHKQWQNYEMEFGRDKWIDSTKRSEKKFKEAGINVRVFDGILGMQGVLDGKVINT